MNRIQTEKLLCVCFKIFLQFISVYLLQVCNICHCKISDAVVLMEHWVIVIFSQYHWIAWKKNVTQLYKESAAPFRQPWI